MIDYTEYYSSDCFSNFQRQFEKFKIAVDMIITEKDFNILTNLSFDYILKNKIKKKEINDCLQYFIDNIFLLAKSRKYTIQELLFTYKCRNIRDNNSCYITINGKQYSELEWKKKINDIQEKNKEKNRQFFSKYTSQEEIEKIHKLDKQQLLQYLQKKCY